MMRREADSARSPLEGVLVSLARLAERRSTLVVALSMVGLAVAATFGLNAPDKLSAAGANDPGGEAASAAERLERADFRETAIVALVRDSPAGGRNRPPRRVLSLLASEPAVESVSDFGSTRQLDYVSLDGNDQFIAIGLRPTGERESRHAAEQIADRLSSLPRVTVGGPAVVRAQAVDEVASDLRALLAIGMSALFLMALLLLRGLAVSALPPLAGALAVAGALFGLRVAAELGEVSVFATNLTAGIGLAAAGAGSLLLIARYQASAATATDRGAALRGALVGAGTPIVLGSLVLTAGFAVLLAFPQPVVYSVGVGSALAALSAAAVTLVVVPALLALLGRKTDTGPRGFAQRAPGRLALAAGVVVLLLGLPFYNLGLASLDPGALPPDRSARQVDDALRTDFAPYRDRPIVIVLAGADKRQMATIAERVARLQSIDRMLSPQWPSNDATVLQAFPLTPPTSAASRDTVRAIREIETPPGVGLEVTGAAARSADLRDGVAAHLPVAAALVLLAAFAAASVKGSKPWKSRR